MYRKDKSWAKGSSVKSLGAYLNYLIKQRGLNPNKLQRETGVARSRIGECINKDSALSMKNLSKIADALKVSLEERNRLFELRQKKHNRNTQNRKVFGKEINLVSIRKKLEKEWLFYTFEENDSQLLGNYESHDRKFLEYALNEVRKDTSSRTNMNMYIAIKNNIDSAKLQKELMNKLNLKENSLVEKYVCHIGALQKGKEEGSFYQGKESRIIFNWSFNTGYNDALNNPVLKKVTRTFKEWEDGKRDLDGTGIINVNVLPSRETSREEIYKKSKELEISIRDIHLVLANLAKNKYEQLQNTKGNNLVSVNKDEIWKLITEFKTTKDLVFSLDEKKDSINRDLMKIKFSSIEDPLRSLQSSFFCNSKLQIEIYKEAEKFFSKLYSNS